MGSMTEYVQPSLLLCRRLLLGSQIESLVTERRDFLHVRNGARSEAADVSVHCIEKVLKATNLVSAD